nr:integrase, catalytic region, zinc finger, CCHC-type, peptidase aspartic, catalytic [Tanacetum cinerariifolium]
MIGDRSQLTNIVNKFLGMVKFGNDHVAKIMGYGDYQIGNVTISRVYFVEGLGNNLFSVRQFVIQTLKLLFVNTPASFVGISHETSVARSPQQNGVVERRNHTLIEAARTMLHKLCYFCGQRQWLPHVTPKIVPFSGLALHEMTPATINSGLVPKPTSSTPFVSLSRND